MFEQLKMKSNLCYLIAFFFITSLAVFQHRAFEADFSQLVKPKIFGRVVDDSNQPISNVLIHARSPIVNPARNIPVPDTFTDEDGRYSFSQTTLYEWYELIVQADGYNSKTITVLSGDEKEIVTVLNPVRKLQLTGKVISSETGKGVAQAQVFLIGSKVYKKSLFTDDDGNFHFDDYPRNIVQGIIYAVKDGYSTEYKVVKGSTTEAELILKPSCQIEGIVTSQSGKPLADCTVELHTLMVSEFLVIRKTNESGRYQFDNLPIGEYQIYITHPEWYQPEDTLTKKRVKTESGNRTSFQTTMREKIPLEGIVTGPDDKPITGACVSVPSYPALISGVSYDIAKTNADGYFKIYSGNLNPARIISSFVQVEVSAVADGFGTGTVTVRKYKENQEQDISREKVVIKLNGIARIFGHVKDTKGNPVSGVSVYLTPVHYPMDTTDASGNYDLGWFALPVKAKETFEVTFKAPRPDDGGMNGMSLQNREAMKIPEAGTQFYLHQTVSVTSVHGRNMELNPALIPADLLTISGAVTNKNSEVVANANLMIFAGNAPQDSWLGRIDRSRVQRGDVVRDGISTLRRNLYFPLARTITDNYGNYTICVVKETSQSFKVTTRTATSATIDPSYYSLGVLSPNNESMLITDIRPDDTTKNIKLDIKLPATP
ncbi:MAG: carboxypeptidase regulatory-like domain-containing protein [Sedimentisphaerales bacterium]|nr:carboxypeptidase regulatory-like domain-containing protein [Sedimentisphaerales bacterium]